MNERAATEQSCCQCGRKGTRGFRAIPATRITHLGEPHFSVGPFVVCASQSACMKRWPRVTDDQLERMYL